MTIFCIVLIFSASIFIFITVQNYQQTLEGLQDQISAFEKREVDLKVSLELEKVRNEEFNNQLVALQDEARELITEVDQCTSKLQTAQQLEQELELKSQKAQFKRDQNRLSRLSG